VQKQILYLAFLLCLIASLAGAQTQTSAQPSHTEIKLFEPWNPHGLSIGIAVTEKLTGNCFAESAASPSRSDAWRCSAGNLIQDPCYMQIMGDQKQLACARDPWSANVNLLTLESTPPESKRKEVRRDVSLPWALELGDGSRCTLMTGGTFAAAGMRANYGCIGGRTLFGDVDKSQPVWRIFSMTDKSIALTQSVIVVAWY